MNLDAFFVSVQLPFPALYFLPFFFFFPPDAGAVADAAAATSSALLPPAAAAAVVVVVFSASASAAPEPSDTGGSPAMSLPSMPRAEIKRETSAAFVVLNLSVAPLAGSNVLSVRKARFAGSAPAAVVDDDGLGFLTEYLVVMRVWREKQRGLAC